MILFPFALQEATFLKVLYGLVAENDCLSVPNETASEAG